MRNLWRIPDPDQPVPSAGHQTALNECQGTTEMSRQPQTYEKSEMTDATRRKKTPDCVLHLAQKGRIAE
jgi:hypothetical protein